MTWPEDCSMPEVMWIRLVPKLAAQEIGWWPGWVIGAASSTVQRP